MGDRIAILETRSRIAQYDTPEKILTDPAGEFVEDFIGIGASIKRLSLSRVRDIESADWPVAPLSASREELQEKVRSSGRDSVLLLDGDRCPKFWVNAANLEGGDAPLEELGRPVAAVIGEDTSLYVALDCMITSYKGSAIVVDEEGSYVGVVDFDAVLRAIDSMRPEENQPNGDSPPRGGDPVNGG